MAATGHLYFNGKDAWTRYGIILATNGLSALMTPPPLKDWITNDVRTEHGVRYLLSDTPKVSQRDVSVTFQLCAKDEDDFLRKYNRFCNDVLVPGVVNIRTKWQPGVEYHCIYESCNQFTQFLLGIATFGLKLIEPDPTDRTMRSYN